MHHKEENRPIVFALFSPRHARLEKKHTHRPPFNGTPELDARLRAPLAERAALTGKKRKVYRGGKTTKGQVNTPPTMPRQPKGASYNNKKGFVEKRARRGAITYQHNRT